MRQSKPKRGRPRTFQEKDRIRLAKLIREHGLRGARRVADVPVSMTTLNTISREFGIKLRKGRRRAA